MIQKVIMLILLTICSIQVKAQTTVDRKGTRRPVDTTADSWKNNADSARVELIYQSNGTGIRTAGTEFIIKDDGKVGIGTSSPAWNFDVQGSSAIGQLKRFSSGSSNTSPGFLFTRSRGSIGAEAVINNGDFLGKIQFRGHLSGGDTDYATFAYVAENSTPAGGRFGFFKTNAGFGVPELMSIRTDNGNVGIGSINPSAKLEVIDSSVNSFVQLGAFYAPNNSTSGNASVLSLGITGSTRNAAQLRYVHNASGNTLNRLDFGWYGVASPTMTLLAGGNVGIGTSNPSATLEVNGTVEIATINNTGNDVTYKPLVWNTSTQRVESTDDNSSIKRTVTNIGSGASADIGTALTTSNAGAGYEIKVRTSNGCGVSVYSKFIASGSSSGFWRINFVAGVSQNGPATGTVSNNGLNVAVSNPLSGGCADGGNTSALNYTLNITNAGQLSITNNGNIAKTYTVIVEKVIE